MPVTCQYLLAQRSRQLFSPTLRSPSLNLFEIGGGKGGRGGRERKVRDTTARMVRRPRVCSVRRRGGARKSNALPPGGPPDAFGSSVAAPPPSPPSPSPTSRAEPRRRAVGADKSSGMAVVPAVGALLETVGDHPARAGGKWRKRARRSGGRGRRAGAMRAREGGAWGRAARSGLVCGRQPACALFSAESAAHLLKSETRYSISCAAIARAASCSWADMARVSESGVGGESGWASGAGRYVCMGVVGCCDAFGAAIRVRPRSFGPAREAAPGAPRARGLDLPAGLCPDHRRAPRCPPLPPPLHDRAAPSPPLHHRPAPRCPPPLLRVRSLAPLRPLRHPPWRAGPVRARGPRRVVSPC